MYHRASGPLGDDLESTTVEICCDVVTRDALGPGIYAHPACPALRASAHDVCNGFCRSPPPRLRCWGARAKPTAIPSGSSRPEPRAATSATTRRAAGASSTVSGVTPTESSPRSAATARSCTAPSSCRPGLAIGGDFRGGFVDQDVQDPAGNTVAVFPMQLDLAARVALPFGFSLSGGGRIPRPDSRSRADWLPYQNFHPVSTSQLISREHYAMWQPEALGRICAPGASTRRTGCAWPSTCCTSTAISASTSCEETYNVSGGFIEQHQELHLTAFRPRFLAAHRQQRKGVRRLPGDALSRRHDRRRRPGPAGDFAGRAEGDGRAWSESSTSSRSARCSWARSTSSTRPSRSSATRTACRWSASSG